MNIQMTQNSLVTLFATGQTGKKPTVTGERRRPGSSAPAGGRPRADAPNRRETGGSGSGSGGGTFRPSSSGGLPSGKLPGSKMSLGMIALVVVCILIYMVFFSGSEGGDLGQILEQEPAAQVDEPAAIPATPRPTATRRPTSQASAGQTWTILMYQDADDKVLEQDIYVDLNEAEQIGSSDNVQIVAQIDRFGGGFSGDGNWAGTRRYFVRQDSDLTQVGSDLVEDLGEVNMANGQTLVDFIVWGVQNYPADKYVLILSDHGMGWPGGWSDSTTRGGGQSDLPISEMMGDQIFLNELGAALEQARSQTGIDQFEMVGMDACLMGHIEVMAALAPHARYAVLSQETEPALGWAYSSFLNQLQNNPGMDGAELGRVIVDSYIIDDQRIVDDQARQELAGGRFVSADAVARQIGKNITLTASDLGQVPALLEALNQFAYSLQSGDQRSIAQARSYAQSFTSIFGREVPPSYIDLGNFAELAARSSGQRSIGEASNALIDAIRQAVIAEKHGPQVSGATGISIYFPNSQLYRSQAAGPASYNIAADQFVTQSLWDEFLTFHYAGESFDLGASGVIAPRTEAVRAPAAGGIEVSPLQVSDSEAAPGQPVLLSADLSGENIGYVKLLVGFLDTDANSIYVADSDYIASPETQEVGGVFYPVWPTEPFTLEFTWEPIVYAINDGSQSAEALFEPVGYGRSAEEAVYSVEGIYTYSSGDRIQARLYFQNGELLNVFGFTSQTGGSNGAPREILPQAGDTFTVLEFWNDLDAQGNITRTAQQEGKTLTFGDQPFTWEILDAAAGQYVVGFIIEDLDGNSKVVFQPITVR
jgi:hypothetical protein